MSDFIANTTVLVACLIFWYSFFSSFIDKRKHINSMAEYLLLVEHESKQEIEPTTNQQKPQINQEYIVGSLDIQIEEDTKDESSTNQLKIDCDLAMKALHVNSAKERKFLIQSVFEKYQPKTVEEFLKKAFS